MASIQIVAPGGMADASARLSACRSCGSADLVMVLDLGRQPIANALVDPADKDGEQPLFPLELMVCRACSLCQVSETIPPGTLFGGDYPYFSSFIPALLDHSRAHAEALIAERKLGPADLVVEVASNDGYLLQAFRGSGARVLGIDPAKGPARDAIARRVPTLNAFFNADLARELTAHGHHASVMLANNVLAHVESINDFVEGFSILLAHDGIAEFEFPYVRELIDRCAFDTIYHEHVFYYSLRALEPIFERHGLHMNDALPLDIHGGSLRLRVSRQPGRSLRLARLMAEERTRGLDTLAAFEDFGTRVAAVRDGLRAMLHDIVAAGGTIAAYGAAAKGATLLNYADLPRGTIRYVVDRNTHKVGKLMPGVMLPIRAVDALADDPVTHLLILPWNFADEIVQQQQAFADGGGTFLVAIPFPQALPA
ncbi:class I SAM-dependent methyltransferase [uncultured Sphingomonas sp.]|uniref:class I SAM-dependent methyltransferase n=1 Tax=uncultured Sphingomonas sp. TaxID=158754 RepID=UPI0025F3D2DD|nr:class I SAM-dependent methyltransferase [uncultured Sphingomonas sp.]